MKGVYMQATKVDWVQELKDYHEFLQWDNEEPLDYEHMSQETGRETLRNDLEFIIGTNGISELYEDERRLCKLLNISLED
jgi:hypothetical protein